MPPILSLTLSLTKGLLAVAALILLSPVAALADSASLSNGQSVTFNYVAAGFPGSTATSTFTYNQIGGTLTMVLTNTSSDDIKLAEIGFNANMTISGTPVITYAAGTVADFVIGTQSLQGAFSLGVNADGGNNSDVLNDGESLTVVFTLSGVSPALLTISGTQVHLTSLPNGQSQKPDGVVTTVPEPASMLLLGTGLVGVYGGVRRKLKARNTK